MARTRSTFSTPRNGIGVALAVCVLTVTACTAGNASSGTSAAPVATAPTSSATSAEPRQSPSTAALAVLATLPTKGRAPRTGYAREQFGTAWTDDTDDPLGHNGCDTRNDILRRDLADETLKPGTSNCAVLTGVLHDPYTATTIDFRRGPGSAEVQIDHVVPLGDAWQTGAQQLTVQQRTELANDPLELLAVDGSTNESKGDGDAATWLPPNKAYRCSYVARQVAVKQAYRLWVTAAERAAMTRVLQTCPGQAVPRQSGQVTITTPAPTASAPTQTSCTTTSSGRCIRGGQFCPKASYGVSGTDAAGVAYRCTGDRTHPKWQRS